MTSRSPKTYEVNPDINVTLEDLDRIETFPLSREGLLGEIEIRPIRTLSVTDTLACPDDVEVYAERMLRGVRFPPLVINEAGQILDGHHRFAAAKLAGYKFVPVRVLSW